LPLRVAFDLDGVLADMEGELTRQAEALFEPSRRTQSPSSPPPDRPDAESSPAVERLPLTLRQQQRLWHHVATIENFWQTLEETEPGIVGRLAAVAAERRWEVIFLTKRPRTAGATSQLQSQRWLADKGFVRPSAYVVEGSRGQIAAALNLDVVVDDRPENCLDVVSDSTAKVILVWRGDDSHVVETVRRLGVGVVRSVAEALDVLKQLEAGGRAADAAAARRRRRRLTKNRQGRR
jgi:hypothetical protein